MKLSVIETDAVPTTDDHILTLSTCPANGYSTRWVVLAVLTEVYPGNGDASGAGTSETDTE